MRYYERSKTAVFLEGSKQWDFSAHTWVAEMNDRQEELSPALI